MTLSWRIHANFRVIFFGILTSEVGRTDPVFGMRSGFFSRSVQAKLQVSVCNGYDFVPLWLTLRDTSGLIFTHPHRHNFDQLICKAHQPAGLKINQTKILFIVQKSKGTFRLKVSVLDKGYNLFPRPHHKALL